MRCRLRSSITMSRKSMLSSSSCSRNGLSASRPERSSSGAMSERISRISSLISAVVMCGNPNVTTSCQLVGESLCIGVRQAGSLSLRVRKLFDDDDGIDTQHSERIVQDELDAWQATRLAGDK